MSRGRVVRYVRESPRLVLFIVFIIAFIVTIRLRSVGWLPGDAVVCTSWILVIGISWVLWGLVMESARRDSARRRRSEVEGQEEAKG